MRIKPKPQVCESLQSNPVREINYIIEILDYMVTDKSISDGQFVKLSIPYLEKLSLLKNITYN